MAWIFQGNPSRFDIDDYLSRYPQLIYWRTNRYVNELALGDPVFIWRAGVAAGAVAVGRVVEAPTQARSVRHPEALGEDLWVENEADPYELKTGIALSETRLTLEDGMVSRGSVKEDSILSSSTIITVPNGTVFRLSANERSALENLWGASVVAASTVGVTEGQRRLRAHYARERSPRLRQDKLKEFRQAHGTLRCEICGFDDSSHHTAPFKDRAFEVHHKNPLAGAATPVRTTLKDLAVLCANCHRAVHADTNVTKNYVELGKLYANKR
jgi:5-methylcytosine-specific restriction endonuclease McrA